MYKYKNSSYGWKVLRFSNMSSWDNDENFNRGKEYSAFNVASLASYFFLI